MKSSRKVICIIIFVNLFLVVVLCSISCLGLKKCIGADFLFKLISALVGVDGLILGFFYYRDRVARDSAIKEVDFYIQRLTAFNNQVGVCNDIMLSLLYDSFNSIDEVRGLLKKLKNRCVLLQSSLEYLNKYIGVEIYQWYSLIDTNPLSVSKNMSEFNIRRETISNQYNERFKDAQKSIFDEILNQIQQT